jgi:hypothetical protein
MGTIVRASIYLIMVFGLGLIVSAQTPDFAILRGEVRDQSSAALPEVEIKVTNTLTGIARTAQTDSSGKFSLSGMPAGTYSLITSKAGFAEVSRILTLAGGTTAEIRLQLNVSDARTEVTVTGAVGGIRTDEPQLGDRLGMQQMEETPLLNRHGESSACGHEGLGAAHSE